MSSFHLKKIGVLTISVMFVVIACTQADATLSQAKRELPFPVLFPETMLENWTIEETIFEDNLLVTSFINNQDGRIELIQDQNIQGLDIEELRKHVISSEPTNDRIEQRQEVIEVYDFVGELAYFKEPTPTVQYTFVSKKDLFVDINGNVPNYQLIGKEISTEELRKFIYTLEVST
ncbi:hypothetical protein [Salipaludibacillus daqingensis]|uniref:hypothetical protein n=1 Tax=Salipaludibacillus daqingensis TaxID=3041001 RepID=UPI002476305F|nr:hypothetical protein [Salipaludibacillus daqingensis]